MWSQPFFIVADHGDDGVPAGDGTQTGPPAATPEVASVVALPVTATALVGLAVWVEMRRRRRRLMGISPHTV